MATIMVSVCLTTTIFPTPVLSHIHIYTGENTHFSFNPSHFPFIILQTMSSSNDNNATYALTCVGAWALNARQTTGSSRTSSNPTLEPHPNIGAVLTQDSKSILADYYLTGPAPAVHATGFLVHRENSSQHTGADGSSVEVEPSWSTRSG